VKDMQTLSDFKRELIKGKAIKLIYAKITHADDKRINLVRYIVKTQGNGVYLNSDKTATKGAYLEFPKASLTTIKGNTISIHEAGYRPLNEQEAKARANIPRDPKQEEIDALSDGSTMYWRIKKYYSDLGLSYLHGEKHASLRYNYNDNNIQDDNIKGDISLTYELIEGGI
jgi:hypothetical protein